MRGNPREPARAPRSTGRGIAATRGQLALLHAEKTPEDPSARGTSQTGRGNPECYFEGKLRSDWVEEGELLNIGIVIAGCCMGIIQKFLNVTGILLDKTKNKET